MKLRKIPLLACLISGLFATAVAATDEPFIDYSSGVKVIYDEVEVDGQDVTRGSAVTSETDPVSGVIEVREEQFYTILEGMDYFRIVIQGTTIATPTGVGDLYDKEVSTTTLKYPSDEFGNPNGEDPETETDVAPIMEDVPEDELDLPSSTNITPPDGELETPEVISPP